jgi:hypothetical protein
MIDIERLRKLPEREVISFFEKNKKNPYLVRITDKRVFKSFHTIYLTKDSRRYCMYDRSQSAFTVTINSYDTPNASWKLLDYPIFRKLFIEKDENGYNKSLFKTIP